MVSEPGLHAGVQGELRRFWLDKITINGKEYDIVLPGWVRTDGGERQVALNNDGSWRFKLGPDGRTLTKDPGSMA